MGLVVKSTFSAGELDPTLWERTTLDKYKNGLATARNVVVSKTGSLLSRPGRFNLGPTKLNNSNSILYAPPGSGLVLEWGVGYVRAYSLSSPGTLVWEINSTTTPSTPYLAGFIPSASIPLMTFDYSGSYVYAFCPGFPISKLLITPGSQNFTVPGTLFSVPAAPISAVATPEGTPTGYAVDYIFSVIQNGQEGTSGAPVTSANLPIAPGQYIALDCKVDILNFLTGITQVNVYRRPSGAGAYGFIGTSSTFDTAGGNLHAYFNDVGQDADFTHTPPQSVIPQAPDPTNLNSATGLIYQQSLVLVDSVSNLEAIFKSQPGFYNNFNRNFPLDDASALNFIAGTSGYARVLRMIDNNGLVVFTSAGIYLNQGQLGPSNLALAKVGRWVINSTLAPYGVPGGCLFVDSSTNTVRNLTWNFPQQVFDAEDVAIYSAHLFRTRSIVAWNFQEGNLPFLYVIFNDGTFATFTFESDQEMKAWTRHDSSPAIKVVYSCPTINPDTTYFLVQKGTQQYIEYSIARYTPPSQIANDPQYKMNPSCANMDSVTSTRFLLNSQLSGTDTITILPNSSTPGLPDDWSGPLQINCGTSALFANHSDGEFTPVGAGSVGQIFRYFDSDYTSYDMTIITWLDANNVIVQPLQIFPSTAALNPNLFWTFKQVTGLSYMNGEFPAVIVDGAVVCSPNNDDQIYPVAQVINGKLTLPGGISGAIVHVGRPIINDVGTLAIDTVEQAPTLVESETVNKIYLKLNFSTGLYVANSFPVDTIVKGMQSQDSFDVDYSQDNPIVGNRAPQPITKRIEVTIPGDWKGNGQICLRNVDPLHFEILSIIPDVEVLTRSDR